jgi:hypothetical protein
MLEKLFNLLSNVNTESLTKMLEREIDEISPVSLKRYSESFVDNGDRYELTLLVGDGANANNVKIDFDGENVIVVYKEDYGNSKMLVRISETLPEDADDSTLDAELNGDKVIISVDKKGKER